MSPADTKYYVYYSPEGVMRASFALWLGIIASNRSSCEYKSVLIRSVSSLWAPACNFFCDVCEKMKKELRSRLYRSLFWKDSNNLWEKWSNAFKKLFCALREWLVLLFVHNDQQSNPKECMGIVQHLDKWDVRRPALFLFHMMDLVSQGRERFRVIH
jgi:hypothetical protein